MDKIAIIGTGFIGGTVGRALASSGCDVTFGSRSGNTEVAGGSGAVVRSVREALEVAEIVILALPAGSIPDLVADHGDLLGGKLVIDATNRMGSLVANSRSELPQSVRYARAFNTLGGENMADPHFGDEVADMFYSAPAPDRAAVDTVIGAVGLRPIYVGEDAEELIDALFRLWIALAITQGRGRRLALKLLEG